MEIFKTGQKHTYFEGVFSLRDRKSNWAHPIDFPTVFTAYGKAIKSGNWQSCTAVNTPDYVIDNYFNGVGNSKGDALFAFWEVCKELSLCSWDNSTNEDMKLLVDKANKELFKLPVI